MKVAFILGGLPFGGIERWLYDLCLEYMRSGAVQAKVFNISGTGELTQQYLDAGIDVECVASSKRALVTYRMDTAVRLRAALKAFAPDIIHTMHFSANHHGRLAAIGLRIPLVTHLHNIKHETRLARRMSDKALSHVTTAYLAVSKAVGEVVRSDHNLACRPVHVLYNAIDLPRFDVPALDVRQLYGIDGPVLIGVGRYVPQKNFDLLIRAVRLLHDQDLRPSLLLVGEGPERPRLEALRKELDLEQHVILTGFQDNVAGHYRASNVFCMPSKFEGFPISHLEAMACSLPAVVSPHVPSLEVASEASLICECDEEDIAAKTGRLLRDEALRGQMAAKARSIAEEHSIPRYAEALHAFYVDILRSAGHMPEAERG